MTLTIRTNNVPRDLVYSFELSEEEKKDFNYYNAEELDNATFFRYRGQVYDLANFICIDDMRGIREIVSGFSKWDGAAGDSYFSGTLVRLVEDEERIVVGSYYS